MTRLAMFLAFDVAAFAMILVVWHAELILTLDRASAQANVVSVQQRPAGRGETPYLVRYRFVDDLGQDYEASATLYWRPWGEHPLLMRTIDIYYCPHNPEISCVQRPLIWMPWILLLVCLAILPYLVLRIATRIKRYGWRGVG